MEAVKLLLTLLTSVLVKMCFIPLRLVNFVFDIVISTLQITKNTLAFFMAEALRELEKG